MPTKKTPTRLYITARKSVVFQFSCPNFFDFCARCAPLLKNVRCTLWFYNNKYFLSVKANPLKQEKIRYTLLEWGEMAIMQNHAFYTEYAKEICKGKGANRLFSALYN